MSRRRRAPEPINTCQMCGRVGTTGIKLDAEGRMLCRKRKACVTRFCDKAFADKPERTPLHRMWEALTGQAYRPGVTDQELIKKLHSIPASWQPGPAELKAYIEADRRAIRRLAMETAIPTPILPRLINITGS